MKSCPICQSSCAMESDQKNRIYHICSSCRFTFLDKKFHISSDEEKKRYELHNNDPEDQGYRKWLSAFIDQAVKPYAASGSMILDYGSGPEPVLASLLREEGYSVQIYDKYFAPQEVSGSFAMITSTEVIEHVDDPIALLKKMKSLVIRGGHVSLKTSFRPSGDGDFFKWWYREDSTHISFFTVASIEKMAEITGFSVRFCDNRSVMVLQKD